MLILLLFLSSSLFATSVTLDTINPQQHTKMPFMIGYLDSHSATKKIGTQLKKDFEFTGQFSVAIEYVSKIETNSDMAQWAKQYPFGLFLSHTDQGPQWRLYDFSSLTMMRGACTKNRANQRATAHAIADEVWPQVTGCGGFFSTKIVYSKQTMRRGRNCQRFLYMRDAVDQDGETEEVLASPKTVSMAPRWKTQSPLVLYSEYTKTNVRLVAVDMHKQRSIVSNFDGVNMQVAYAPDGTSVVYCLSHAPRADMPQHQTTQLYFYNVDAQGKPQFQRLTNNKGNNFSPCWGPGKSIFYASDVGRLGAPNIYWLDIPTGNVVKITTGNFAVSPSFAHKTGRLAYTKMIGGRTQVFAYDLQTKLERQITFDASNKDDVSWSPCGNLLSYTREEKGQSRIAIFNTLTNEQRLLTAESQDCCYPCWSPMYEELPVIS